MHNSIGLGVKENVAVNTKDVEDNTHVLYAEPVYCHTHSQKMNPVLLFHFTGYNETMSSCCLFKSCLRYGK